MAKMRKHAHQELSGEALDNHLMVMHDWDTGMVAHRGTESEAQNYNYAATWHESAHQTEHLD